MNEPVHVIGMGLSPTDLTASHLALIERAAVLVGGKRHLSYFGDVMALKKEISSPVSRVLDFIEAHMTEGLVVVLASGDPFFFGIGKTLIERLGPDQVIIHPNVTSMAAAFARLKLPWQDAAWVSLHGRDNMSALVKTMDDKDLLCVLTDPKNDPWAVKKQVDIHDYAWQMWVLQNLGTPDEKMFVMDEHTEIEEGFSQPNVVVLQKGELAAPSGPLRFGTPDNWFVHEKSLITKAPVRVLSLAALELAPNNTVWDLGAGSGSVGIEATLFLPDGFVYAVEKNQQRVAQIKANVDRFEIKNLSVILSQVPDGLTDLPRPDRVFIGGSGKNMDQVLDVVTTVLTPFGRIVVNTILMETLHLAVSVLEEKGFDVSLTQAQISKSRNMPWGRRMEALNPVWIIAAQKGNPMMNITKKYPILFTGAGPGAPDLITVRGMKALEAADYILYAGSLVPEAVLTWAGDTAQKVSSAGMHLEEMVDAIAHAWDKGLRVVRLHTGDSSLYGAIAEQMLLLDQREIPYEVIPGVTAAFAAAAALKVEYTVPEQSQTLIFTRISGRTPVPEKESLERLAAHKSSMAIYLSAGMAEQVQKILAATYGPKAPVAVAYRVSHPEERIIVTIVDRLAETMAENGINRLALIIVGPFLETETDARSLLYDRAFAHGYREKT